MDEQQTLLLPREKIALDKVQECFCEQWSDGSSCTSYYSDSDSSVPEWETSISSTGELLFIECDPVVSHTSNENDAESFFSPETSIRHSTRSKFLKLLRRRDSKRRSKRSVKSQDTPSNNPDTSKVKFHDHAEGEIREVVLKIDQENNRKLGRRATLVESLLGLTVSTLSDGCRLMVAGFIPDSEASKHKSIKIGDCLKSINEFELTLQNLNSVLEQVSIDCKVTLKLQRVAGVEVTKNPPINELSNQSNFVQQLINAKVEEASILSSLLCEHPVGILYVNMESLSEGGPEFEGVSYCYPQPYEKNILCTSKGVFITLNHLLHEITETRPRLTSVLYKDQLSHIAYSNFGKNLLLFMLPDNQASAKEMLLMHNEIIRMLEFMYQTADRAFEVDAFKSQLDHFFSRFFAKLLSGGLWPKAEQSLELVNLKLKVEQKGSYKFEDVLSVARSLKLPDEAQMQIDDALTELEASDYREWNEDPLDCQRLFTFLGSAIYHSGYLLASHFVHEDLIDVHTFCRQQGLFHLSKNEPVRTLILWREVFPSSCNRGIESSSSLFVVPEGRRYLLVVGSGKDILAVIMEAGGCTEPPDDNMGPDAFYVEEVQATLAHLQDLGISNLAEHWITTNPGLQVTLPEIPLRKKSDFLGNLPFTKTSPSPSKDSVSQIQKKPEVTSILKRRIHDQGTIGGANSSFSLVDDNSEINSEDSMSQGGYSERSEVSADEPVLGRRVAREKRNLVESDEENSDIDDYRECSYSNSSYDLTELRQSLLTEMAEIKPHYLTAGAENVLFHYIELDTTEGLLLCPPEHQLTSKTLEEVLNNFRKCALQIHCLFQNSLRFKNMLAQDMAKSPINKNLIAIKEQGSLFECTVKDDATKKYGKLRYWVIGRHFSVPHSREVYICYQDTVPQNIVEIAFKLGVTA